MWSKKLRKTNKERMRAEVLGEKEPFLVLFCFLADFVQLRGINQRRLELQPQRRESVCLESNGGDNAVKSVVVTAR